MTDETKHKKKSQKSSNLVFLPSLGSTTRSIVLSLALSPAEQSSPTGNGGKTGKSTTDSDDSTQGNGESKSQ